MQYELNLIGFSLFKNACRGQGNEQSVPGRKSHSPPSELLVRCLGKMADPPIPRGVLMSPCDAVGGAKAVAGHPPATAVLSDVCS